jgi:hypothetical protein
LHVNFPRMSITSDLLTSSVALVSFIDVDGSTWRALRSRLESDVYTNSKNQSDLSE